MKDDIKPSTPAGKTAGEIPESNQSDYQEPVFKTPDEVVEEEAVSEIEQTKPDKPKQSFRERLKHLTKRQRILAILGIGLITILLTARAMALFVKVPVPAEVAIAPKVDLPPETVPSRLTGVQVKPEVDALPVTAVMIENSPDARPQSGLRDAGVVFEAIAEGGITRFLTLFHEAQPESIGPVRSVRPYYLDWVTAFDAPIAHAGGSAQALAQLKADGLKDLEAFQNPGAYRRVSSRFAPHNLYTSRDALLKLQKSKKWTSSTFSGFERKKKEEPLETPTASNISLTVSSYNYNPAFKYNNKNNSYLRTLAGQPHKDEKSNKQIEPKVVIALVVPHRYAGIYSVYQTRGKGTAYVFQDGNVIKGTWHKKDKKTQITFKNAKGETLGLNAGQTWITVVGDTGRVAYKP